MEWYGYVLLVAGLLIVAFIFFLIGMLYRKKVAEREIGSAETEAQILRRKSVTVQLLLRRPEFPCRRRR